MILVSLDSLESNDEKLCINNKNQKDDKNKFNLNAQDTLELEVLNNQH